MKNFKIYTASFYQVRNLEPNMIPLSTALGEPAWFHDSKDRNYTFIDKRGIINGLVAEPFQFDTSLLKDVPCKRDCDIDIDICPFMKAYRESIEKHSFDYIMNYLSDMIDKVREVSDFKGDPIIILLVYERPDIRCAERPVIQQYFKDHGIEVNEWTPDLIYKNILF